MTFKIQPTLTLTLMGGKTGSLVDLTETEVSYMLCFKPNATHLDDPDKVKHLWSFQVDGKPHSVWSYKDSHKQRRWSTHGSDELFQLVFGDHYIPSRKVGAAQG